MLQFFKPWAYQEKAIEHIKEFPFCGLFLEMGLGKTISCLMAINDLLKSGEIKKVLVIAPVKVARHTWPAEVAKWKQTAGLSIVFAGGPNETERKKALLKPANIYTINCENTEWLINHHGMKFPYDLVIIDESSKFKNPQSKRFKALKKIRPLMKRVVILTGTPIPNGLIDLWSQLYLLDMGKRLGETIGQYRKEYFTEGQSKGHVVYNYNLKKVTKKEKLFLITGPKHYENLIYSQIADICISMKAKDYLDLPPLVEVDVPVHLTRDEKRRYDDFEVASILEFINEQGIETADAITAMNAAGLTNKLLQYANGAVYDEQRNYREVHDQKLDALAEILETTVDQGHNLLLFYSFKHDLSRIQKYFAKYKPKVFDSKSDDIIDKWNRGEIPFVCAHPASAGHGLNIQSGGHNMVWYGLPWSSENYLQAIARLHRQGQTKKVIAHRLLTVGTMDYEVRDALITKGQNQERLLSAVKAKVAKVMKQHAIEPPKNKIITSLW